MEREPDHKCNLCGETFLVKIHFVDNLTWQGTINWLNGKKKRTFRSLLELFLLLQEAIEKDMANAPTFHSWDDTKWYRCLEKARHLIVG